MKFTVTPTELPEVLVLEHQRFGDERGYFAETYRADAFAEAGIPALVQHNQARSVGGVLRGIHFQNDPRAVGKLVRCLQGRIVDVAVDLRRGSPRYKKWIGVELTADDQRMVWVPPGFGHGYCTLSEIAEVEYKQSDYYEPELDRAIAWNEPEIGVQWPIDAPVLSHKDQEAPRLADSDVNFVYPG